MDDSGMQTPSCVVSLTSTRALLMLGLQLVGRREGGCEGGTFGPLSHLCPFPLYFFINNLVTELPLIAKEWKTRATGQYVSRYGSVAIEKREKWLLVDN